MPAFTVNQEDSFQDFFRENYPKLCRFKNTKFNTAAKSKAKGE